MAKGSDKNEPYCKLPWRLQAAILVVAALGTFVWGFHVLEDYEHGLLKGAKSAMAGGSISAVGANNTEQLTQNMRSSVVSVIVADANGTETAVSSGVILSNNGSVATTYHSIAGQPEIFVEAVSGGIVQRYDAEIVKFIQSHDVALLKLITRDSFKPVTMGDSQHLTVGDNVYAFGATGQAFIGNGGMIVSTGQDLKVGEFFLSGMMQTDAVHQWSQTGGPLVDSTGRMVGLNVAIQRPIGGTEGYAIPSNILVAHFRDVVNFQTSATFATQPAGNLFPQQGVNKMQNIAMLQAVTAPQEVAQTGSSQWWQHARNLFQQQNRMALPGMQGLGSNQTVQTFSSRGVDVSHSSSAWSLWGYSLETIIGLLLLGLISGISGGMMTMGGGIIKVAGLMLFFGYGTLLIRPVAYITNIFLYGSAAYRYSKDNLVVWSKTKPLIPWAVVGVVIGYFLGNYMGSSMIQYCLGIFALSLSVKIFMEIINPDAAKAAADERTIKDVKVTSAFGDDDDDNLMRDLVGGGKAKGGITVDALMKNGLLGLPMGIVSGILGISGGVIEVPLQNYVAKVPLKNAIANSSVLVFFASLVGSIIALYHGTSVGAFDLSTPIVLALFLIPGAYAGGLIGAWITKIAPMNVLRWVYVVLMAVIALRMFIQ